MREMETMINGQPATWTREIWEQWYTHVERADPKLYDTHGLPRSANYFTPRPWQDEYDRGDKKEGFSFICGRQVCQVVTNGYLPWTVAYQDPPRP